MGFADGCQKWVFLAAFREETQCWVAFFKAEHSVSTCLGEIKQPCTRPLSGRDLVRTFFPSSPFCVGRFGSAQYEDRFAAGSLGAVTAHRIKWILSGRSAGEQMRQWQQALQAVQIIDAGPKRVSPLSAFQVTETKEGGMMVITTTVITTTDES